MKKPIDIAILRGPQFYSFSDCYLDTVERRLFKKNKRIEVTPKALEVLQVLVENAGVVVSKDELLGQIWGESFVEEGNLPVQISKLRSVLGANKDEPFIVTESGVGYKFVSRVKMVDDDEWSDIIENELSKREDGKHQYTSIAIMPLLNENGDEEVEYLAEGITESLINSLSRVPELRVIARNTVFQFKNKEIDIKKLGRRLRVSTILTGRVRLVRDNLVIGVELTKVADGTQIWGTQLNEPFDDIFEVQNNISEAIGDELRLRIDGFRTKDPGGFSDYDFEPYRLFLKGRYYLRTGGANNLTKAIENFQESLSIDPTRQEVYLNLANCQILRLAYDQTTLENARIKTSKLLTQAQSLTGDKAGVLCLKGRIAMNLDWKFEKAKRFFQMSIQQNPNSASCLCSYANLLTTLGLFSEAMSVARKVRRLDPISLRNQRTVAKVLYRSEQYEAAIVVLNEALELDPFNYDTLMVLAAAYIELDQIDSALVHLEAARKTYDGLETLAVEGYAYAKSGDRKKARAVVQNLVKLTVKRPVPNIYLSYILAALGEYEMALDRIEMGIESHEMNLLSLKSNPMLSTLRGDSRFEQLVSSMGLCSSG